MLEGARHAIRITITINGWIGMWGWGWNLGIARRYEYVLYKCMYCTAQYNAFLYEVTVAVLLCFYSYCIVRWPPLK